MIKDAWAKFLVVISDPIMGALLVYNFFTDILKCLPRETVCKRLLRVLLFLLMEKDGSVRTIECKICIKVN